MNLPDAFLRSAMTTHGVNTLADCRRWFSERKEFYRFDIDEIFFNELTNGEFTETPTAPRMLAYTSGHSFQMAGIDIQTEFMDRQVHWQQPIIQAEVGILGFIVQNFDGILHFLVLAKMEPGNIDYIPLSPTVQATRSHFRQVHPGRNPRYVDFFLNASPDNVYVDSLQSEQGSRFFQKRNRNIIIKASGEISVEDDFHWLTLGQLHILLRDNNVINMDSRTVLASIPLGGISVSIPAAEGKTAQTLFRTLAQPLDSIRYADEMRWLTQRKFLTEATIRRVPIDSMDGWIMTDREIHHRDGKYFSVLAVSIQVANRKVSGWTQPLMKSTHTGLMVSPIRIAADGTLEVLVQSRFEPGVADLLELGPAVQTFPEDDTPDEHPFLTNEILGGRLGKTILDTMQSEEGGRFFRDQNRNVFVLVDSDEIPSLPEILAGFLSAT